MADALTAARADRLALPALVLGAVAIGCSPLFVRLSELAPTATGVHRLLWALPLLYVWMRREAGAGAGPTAAELRSLLLPGLLFAGDLFFWHWSIAHTTVANATLFANFAPLVVVIGAWTVLGERVTRRFFAALALSLAGAGLLVAGSVELGGSYVLGDALGIVTAGFFGSYMIAVARLRGRLSASAIMFWSSVVTCAALLPVAIVSGESLWPTTWNGFAVLLALAWISQAAGQGLIAYALGHLPASFSSLVILIEPVTAAALGWIVLSEALGPLQGLGGALVLAGIFAARGSARRVAA